MEEYIKREDALDAVLFALVGTGFQSKAIYAIREIPTEDVVPRSEFEYWEAIAKNNQKWIDKILADKEKVKQELDKFIQEIDQIQKDKAESHAPIIDKAKQEVAREIFEDFIQEIEFQKRKAEAAKNSFCTPYSEDYHFWRGKECGLERLLEYVVKKENKYIGE